jgi:hypothetical protein
MKIEEIEKMLEGLRKHLIINGEVRAYIIYPKELLVIRDLIAQVREARKQAVLEAADFVEDYSKFLSCTKTGHGIPAALRRKAEEEDRPHRYKDGEPCEHPGCLSHISHPCEGCGRVAGRYAANALRRKAEER